MFRFRLTVTCCLVVILCRGNQPVHSADKIELNAQGILARVDRVMDYPKGEIKGVLKHIEPNGKFRSIRFSSKIQGNNSFFAFRSKKRGEEVRVLYNYGGEDIWVYDIHALKLFHKMGVDKYDSVLETNYTFLDLSNASFQSNYVAKIRGRAFIKGVECYRLELMPLFKRGLYGELTLFVSLKNFLPMRIDFYDKNRIIYKFMSLAKTIEKGSRIIPVRYDMLNIRTGTITILSLYSFNEGVKFQPEIFRHQNIGEKHAPIYR